MPVLDKRMYCYYDGGGNYQCRNSSWDNWIRWVVLGVVIIGFFLLFCLCSFFTARRRRRMGRNPYWGTGWAGGRTAPGHNAPQYHNGAPSYQQQYPNQYSNAPPQYTPSNAGYYGANQSYYGQNNGVELQNQPRSPQAAYQPQAGGDSVYEPPVGPPPGKDGIIR